MQQESYAPIEPEAKLHLDVEDVVPSPEIEPVRVGSKFHKVKTPKFVIEDVAVCSPSSEQLYLIETGINPPNRRTYNMPGPATGSPASVGSQRESMKSLPLLIQRYVL